MIINLLSEKQLQHHRGRRSFTFNINKKDWGRYLIRATTPAGHSTGKMLLVDWPWEYGEKETATEQLFSL